MKHIYIFGIVLLLFVLAGCASGGNVSPSGSQTPDTIPTEYASLENPLDASAAAEGAKVFQTNCQACHGAAGKGDGPAASSLVPPPADLAQLGQSASDAYLFWRISTGVPGTAMVAWRGVLSQTQIWQVITFIHTLHEP